MSNDLYFAVAGFLQALKAGEEEYLLSTLKDLRQAYQDYDYDPTPYCHVCGANSLKQCDCGPRAGNE